MANDLIALAAIFISVMLLTDLAIKQYLPKSVNDLKLIHASKILENNKALADSRITYGDLPGRVITMHVVEQHPAAKKKIPDKNPEEIRMQNSCSCVIL